MGRSAGVGVLGLASLAVEVAQEVLVVVGRHDAPRLLRAPGGAGAQLTEVAALLEERGVDFDTVEYHVEGLPEDTLRSLLAKADLRPGDVLRRREPLVAELGLDRELPSDDELIALMVEHPVLVQRPIVERGDRAVLARPVERVLELL